MVALKLTQDELKAILDYSPETGDFTWNVSRSNRVKVGQRAGCKDVKSRVFSGYTVIYVGRLYQAHRLAWLWMTGEWPPKFIDHINGNRSDNRWENLRLADRSQNGFNKPKRSDNSSGYKGVHLHRASGLFAARCKAYGYERHLGYFKTPEAAHAAYCEAAKHMHGEFARTS